ncbi:MAG: hypothetical protein FWH55_13115 [Oscillospiraceae bacterium]|nr:hypothetical protein [Oscillospiraceae bacterium]
MLDTPNRHDSNFPDKLYEIARLVGADTPFCLVQGTCLAEGVGDVLTPLPGLTSEIDIVIVKPDISVSTAFVYNNLDLLSLKKSAEDRRQKTVSIVDSIKARSFHESAIEFFNILEDVTLKTHPELVKIKSELKNFGASHVLMSGSGGAIFAIFPIERTLSPNQPNYDTTQISLLETIDNTTAVSTPTAAISETSAVSATTVATATGAAAAARRMQNDGLWACLCTPYMNRYRRDTLVGSEN